MDIDIENLIEAPFKEMKPMLVDSATSTPPKESKATEKRQDTVKQTRSRSRERHFSSRHSSREYRSPGRDRYSRYSPERYRDDSRERRRDDSRGRDRYREDKYRERYERERYRYSSRDRYPRHERYADTDRYSRERESSRYAERRHASRERRDTRYVEERRHSSRERRDSRYTSREREQPRYRPKSPVRLPSPVSNPAERDKRTVFCTQLAARLTNRDIFEFFRPCGRIREAKLVIDKITKRHKGVAYVEFFEIESVEKATSMSNQKLLGIPIIVQTAESEKNRLAEQGIQLDLHRPPPQVITNKLYVGNLPPNLNEEDLKRLFEPYGGLDYVNLHVDANTGKSKGFALIQYRTTYDARQAISNMNEKEIQGRKIKVGPITDREKKKSLDDDDDVKISNNSLARMELMAKLSRDEVRTTSTEKKMETCCMVLKNMFVAEEYLFLTRETSPNWVKELEEDVQHECKKFGEVRHIAVDKDSDGHIYLKFDSIKSAQRAIDGLNGRYFAKRQVSAVFVADAIYYAKYPSAASK